MHEEITTEGKIYKEKARALQVILSGQPEGRVGIEEPERGKLPGYAGFGDKCLSTDHEIEKRVRSML